MDYKKLYRQIYKKYRPLRDLDDVLIKPGRTLIRWSELVGHPREAETHVAHKSEIVPLYGREEVYANARDMFFSNTGKKEAAYLKHFLKQIGDNYMKDWIPIKVVSGELDGFKFSHNKRSFRIDDRHVYLYDRLGDNSSYNALISRGVDDLLSPEVYKDYDKLLGTL